ncbi:glycosyltransferase [Pseudomonas lundensis]|uniref:glycosyltransferase n=1 Tax=Serratia proteamaculans TaxID=28151 RepID=UPI002980D885|nr:glycosyltransferase [Serratia proteamaculans]MDW5500239.1 glycosyltransferase [Serratia proteamaculans]MDW5505305.1 glycosyltransferase [Pseudomonas lundensis]
MSYRGLDIALVVPCYNEETTIFQVVSDFKNYMPEITPYVFDNNSTDRTKEEALRAGAKVISVHDKGKGNVVRRIFADVNADVYVMVDGDATYDAASVHQLVDKLIDDNLDMVVGCRKVVSDKNLKAYRLGHEFGNKMLTASVTTIFGGKFTDMLSGYRAFTRRYAKSFPALSHGFETETELTVHALELRMPYGEVSTLYGERPEGSVSKLSTYKDGVRILKTIVRLFMREKPLYFFGIMTILFCSISVILAIPIFSEYFETGLVPRLPTAVLSAMTMLAGFLTLSCGLILDNITIARHESRRLAYLLVSHQAK